MGPSELSPGMASYFLYFLIPLWIGAGFADWVLHRRTRIERTSGIKESLLHGAQMAEVGVPALMALLFQVNALIILMMLIGFVLHEATALWDVRYAGRLRSVTPLEQHVHSFLEVLPLIAGSLLILLHWDQFLALWGMGPNPARFTIELKDPPLPPTSLLGIFFSIVILNAIPFLEEAWRCYRFRGQRHSIRFEPERLAPN